MFIIRFLFIAPEVFSTMKVKVYYYPYYLKPQKPGNEHATTTWLGKKKMTIVASFRIETEFENTYCVRGYHMYSHVWEAALRETLEYGRKPLMKSMVMFFAAKNSGTIGGWTKISHLETGACYRCWAQEAFLYTGGWEGSTCCHSINLSKSPNFGYFPRRASGYKPNSYHICTNKQPLINFNDPIMRCRKYIACLIFVVVANHEIFLTRKICPFTVS